MLDADAYDVGASSVNDSGSGGGSAGRTSSAGHPGATGGSGVSPSAGNTSSGGKTNGNAVDPELAVTPCAQYCPGYGVQCRERLNGQECFPTCQNELNGFGKSCQALGIKALTCLTPFFSPGGGDCDAAVGRALSKCNKVVKQFESCKRKYASGNNPNPTPTTPTTPADPTTCPSGGRALGPDACVDAYDCGDGRYIAECRMDPNSMLARCRCTTPTDTRELSVPRVANPCELAAESCF